MSVVKVGGTGATSHTGDTWTFDNVAIDLSSGTTSVVKLVEIEGENLPTDADITLDSTTQATATIRQLSYGDPSIMAGAQVTITPSADVETCVITLQFADLATIILNCVVTLPDPSVTGMTLNSTALTPDTGTKTYRGSVTLTGTSGTATLVIQGEHLNRMATPAVSQAQNCSVALTASSQGDTSATFSLNITNVTAGVNGGATITLADATLILTVVAPSQIITRVNVGGYNLSKQNEYLWGVTTSISLQDAQSLPSSSITLYCVVEGSGLDINDVSGAEALIVGVNYSSVKTEVGTISIQNVGSTSTGLYFNMIVNFGALQSGKSVESSDIVVVTFGIDGVSCTYAQRVY